MGIGQFLQLLRAEPKMLQLFSIYMIEDMLKDSNEKVKLMRGEKSESFKEAIGKVEEELEQIKAKPV